MNKLKNIYPEIQSKLETGQNFSFVRYGDGEWATVFNNETFKKYIKIWGPAIEPMSSILREIVESKPTYYFGVQRLSYKMFKNEIDDITLGMELLDGDILHDLSLNNSITNLFKTLNEKNIVLVGPECLKGISVLNLKHHIVTREYCVWEDISILDELIRNYISKNQQNNLIFLYCCSLAAKVLINNFHKEKITQIDMGSVLDPYVGINSRGYHSKVLQRLGIEKEQQIIPKMKR